MTAVTGVSGSGKSTLVSQALVELVADRLGQKIADEEDKENLEDRPVVTLAGRVADGMQHIRRLVVVDQKPIGRTPRSNLATYTGLFDHVRKLFASTKLARSRKYDSGRFSCNVAKGRCETCAGEGFVSVELLFLPSVYSPCPACHGARFNRKTLEVLYRDKSIADVLGMSVDAAAAFFADEGAIERPLRVLQEVGLGYLRLGQAATELSGGEAQRVKLATELQRTEHGRSLYVLDEPTTGLHPSDVERLLRQLQRLVAAGNNVIVVEHDMQVIASCDWLIDIGPGPGEEGGRIVAEGTPEAVISASSSKTAPYLARYLNGDFATAKRA
jgi:excinuclease ABC subunit A